MRVHVIEGNSRAAPVAQGRPVTAPPTEPKSSVVDVFVARQPIFDRHGVVYAYELLYRRNAEVGRADGTSGEVMGSEVLVHTFLNIGIDRVTGGSRAFLNFTREMLLDGVFRLFSPREIVVEVLESVEPDAEVIAACEDLVKAGYTLALDDFIYRPAFDPLLRVASVVKLDVLAMSPDDLGSTIERLKPFGVTLLAEKVETAEMRDACVASGFTYFQGYYFSKPELLSTRDLSAAQVTILRLMNLLRDIESSDLQLDDAFRSDVSLSYKLLRTVNSAAMGGSGIESIRHAIRLVGRAELHRWMSLLLVTSVAGGGGAEDELVHTALRRARMCELVALDRGDRRGGEGMFMVGLFSLLDAILKIPLQDLLERIELASEVRRALLMHSGPFAAPLALVEAYERGAWDVAAAEADTLGLRASEVPPLYLAALSWARERMEVKR